MEPTTQFPAMLAALMFAAMLAAYIQVLSWRHKARDDRRRYHERVKRNHGTPRRGRRMPPGA
jgi:hypothetical protein